MTARFDIPKPAEELMYYTILHHLIQYEKKRRSKLDLAHSYHPCTKPDIEIRWKI